ncbi:BRCT domain-containing protein [Synechocystis sp. LKSZ1]|uniref:BRCT domain-containing protein n=1 Tax=Synechocystis sp. LKSZ1 TaxID=3144951 RepID=UPI00336BD637
MTIVEWVYPVSGFLIILALGLVIGRRRTSQEPAVELSQSTATPERLQTTLEPPFAQQEARPEELSSAGHDTLHLQGKIHHLEKDLAHFRQSLAKQLEEQEYLRHHLQHRDQAVLTLQRQLLERDTTYEQSQRHYQEQLQSLQSNNEALSQRLQQSIHQLTQWQQQAFQEEGWQSRCQVLQQQLQAWEAKYQAQAKDLAQIQGQKTTQEQQLAQLERQYAQAQATLQQQLQAWEAKYQTQTEEISRLRGQEATRERQLARLEQQLAQAQANLHQQSQRLAAQDQLEQQYAQALQVIDTLTRKQETLHQTLGEAQEEGHRLSIALKTAETAKKERELAYQELRVKLEALHTQLESVTTQKKAQATELKSAQARLQALEQQLLQAPPLAESEPKPEIVEHQAETPPSVLEPEPEVVAPQVEILPPVVEPEPEVVEPEVSSPELIAEPEPEVSSPEVVAETEPEAPTVEASSVIDSSADVPMPVVATEDQKPIREESAVHPLLGKKVVIAGTLGQMNREEAKDRIQACGGSVTSSPSSKTHYVIVGKAPGDKLKKAQKLGIPQLSETQFLKLLDSQS